MGGKGNKPFVNGIILAAVAVYLAIFFSIRGMWNVGAVFALVLIAALSAFQFFLHFRFFKKKK